MARKKKQLTPEEKEAKLSKAFNAVASTPEGLEVLRYIYDRSGYADPIMTLNRDTMEVNAMASLYNLSKRDFWADSRKYLTDENKTQIEIGGDKE